MSKRDPTERNNNCLVERGKIDEAAQGEALEPPSPRRGGGRMQVEEAYL